VSGMVSSFSWPAKVVRIPQTGSGEEAPFTQSILHPHSGPTSPAIDAAGAALNLARSSYTSRAVSRTIYQSCQRRN